jgi:hypothetical protein
MVSFFDRIVAASGLASVIAPSALRRALVRVGIDPSSMTSRDLAGALPSIEKSLSVYLPTQRVSENMRAIRALARVDET